jgi:uncharacterized OsmC-like protein
MTSLENIKTDFERSVKALSLKPALGLGVGVSKTKVVNGLVCEIEEGPWKFSADMPKQVGGNGSAPTPGVYGRAALGSCLAIGYMFYFAKHSVPILSLEVEVQADYNDGALFGTTTNVSPGYLEVRYIVTVESDASEEDILKVLNDGDAHSPYLDVFSHAQKCVRQVYINTSQNK